MAEKMEAQVTRNRPMSASELREYARAHAADALKTLIEISENEDAPRAVREDAAQELRDRSSLVKTLLGGE